MSVTRSLEKRRFQRLFRGIMTAVFSIVTGEPFKQSAKLTGEPIKMKG